MWESYFLFLPSLGLQKKFYNFRSSSSSKFFQTLVFRNIRKAIAAVKVCTDFFFSFKHNSSKKIFSDNLASCPVKRRKFGQNFRFDSSSIILFFRLNECNSNVYGGHHESLIEVCDTW